MPKRARDGGGCGPAAGPASPELAAATRRHEAWTQAFIAAHAGRRPTRQDIDADPEAAANAATMRELTIAAAEPFVAGQCQYFVWRKKRFCASRAAHAAARFCSDHEPAKLAQLQRDSLAGQQRQGQPPQPQPEAAATAQQGGEEAEKQGQGPRRGRGVKTNQERNPKRMTNPLSKQFQTPVPAPPWQTLFAEPGRPLFLDIGCARGRFMQELALRRPESYNYCGVEIFAPLVVAANEWVASQELRHLHFIAANINASLESLQFPSVRVICLQFPDPWHAKHGKRRVMSPPFAQQLAGLLPTGGLFYFCSDHGAIAAHIRECMLGTGSFEPVLDDEIAAAEASEGLLWRGGREVLPSAESAQQEGAGDSGAAQPPDRPEGGEGVDAASLEHLSGRGEKSKCRSGDVTPATAGDVALPSSAEGYLQRSPFPVPTERDRVCEMKWRPVWRMLLRRKPDP